MTDPWCSAADVKARDGFGTLTDDQATAVAQQSSDILNALSGRQFGLTTSTVRPTGCSRSCDYGPPSQRDVVGWGLPLELAYSFGQWPLAAPEGGMWGAQCDGCGDWSFSALELKGPIVWTDANPITVTVDGTTLASDGTKWVLIDKRWLLRVDGNIWRRCQDIRLASTELGTLQVVYSYGTPVPAGGVQSAISLACQLALLFGWIAGDCQLPQRVSSLVREGVSVQIIDSLSIIKDGGTGITDIDMWLTAVNPCGLRRRPRVYSPGFGNRLPQITGAPS